MRVTIVKKSILFSLIIFFSVSVYSQIYDTPKTVKVGYYPADSFFDGAYEYSKKDGYGYEYIKEIANYTGWKYEYVYDSWPNLYEQFLNGQIDILADISITEERKSQFLFPSKPMGIESSWIFTSKNNNTISAKDLKTLNGKKIGVSKHSTQIDDLRKWLKENNITAQIISYSSDTKRQSDCIKGIIDASVELDINVVLDLKALYKIGSCEYYLAVNKNKPDLLDDINNALKHIYELRPNYTDELYNKYFGNVLVSKKLSDEEDLWLKEHSVIKVGCLRDNLPYTNINPLTNKEEGLVIDWFNLLKRNLELTQNYFTYIFYDTQNHMEEALKKGEVDVIFPVNKEFLDDSLMFSSTFIDYSYNLLFTGEYSLQKYTRIATSNQYIDKSFIESIFPQFTIIECETLEDCLNLVINNQADSAFLNTYKTNNYISNYRKYANLNSIQVQQSIETQFAVNRTNIPLLTLINREIAIVPSSTVISFMSKNIRNDIKYTPADLFANYRELFIGIIDFFFLILIVMIILLINHKKLKIANIKAEAASKAKSSFLMNMSHDIRTPMNAIIGYTNMAKKYIDNRSKVLKCLDKAQIASEHLLSLISDVLDMSRIENEQIKIEKIPVNLVQSQEEIIDIVEQGALNNNITIKHDFSKVKNRDVFADILHLNRITLNILSNAIKYSKEGGSVFYTIEQLEKSKNEYGTYIFTIQDNGIGMSKEFQEHLFELFERENTSNNVQGTGIGLTITKKLLELMGGKIVIHSDIGKGTTVVFQLTLQLQEASFLVMDKHPVHTEIANSEIKYEFDGKRILVVEDNLSNREITKDILETAGLLVEEAEDGNVAVEMVKNHSPQYYDYILMDIQMPVMDGYQAARIIRELPDKEKSNIPIISMSADVFADDNKKALQNGMNAHITKPIEARELLDTLANW